MGDNLEVGVQNQDIDPSLDDTGEDQARTPPKAQTQPIQPKREVLHKEMKHVHEGRRHHEMHGRRNSHRQPPKEKLRRCSVCKKRASDASKQKCDVECDGVCALSEKPQRPKNFFEAAVEKCALIGEPNCAEQYCHAKQQKVVVNIKQHRHPPPDIIAKCSNCAYRSSIENWKPPLGVIYCPKCQSCEIPLIRTRTRKTNKLYSVFGIDCMQHCWPLCFIPYLFPPSTHNTLHCAQCFNFLGTYEDRNKCVRPNPEYADFDYDCYSAEETKRRERVQYEGEWTEFA